MLIRIRQGITWSYSAMAIGMVIQLCVTATTARLLDPSAFGLIAMANIILRFGSYAAHMGVGRALIQKPTITEMDIRATFTSSILLGFCVAIVIFFLAPIAAVFFQTLDLIPLLHWLALTFVLNGSSTTAQSLLRRELRFRDSAIIEVVSYAVGYAIPTLTFALYGLGVWSLVAGILGQATVTSVLAYGLKRHTVIPTFDVKTHSRLLGFGAKVSFIGLFEFIGSALDSMIIGRFGTAVQLGLYNRAYMLSSLPTYHLNNGIAKVLFPVLSDGQNNRVTFSQTLNHATEIAIKIVLSMGVGMALAAPEIVRVILGAQWIEAIPIFSVLSVGLAVNLLSTFPGISLEAVGTLRKKSLVQTVFVVSLAVILIGCVTIYKLNLLMVAITIAIAYTLRTGAFFLLGVHAGLYRYRDLFRHLAIALLCATLSFFLIGGVLLFSRACSWPKELSLAIAIAAGIFQLVILFWRDISNRSNLPWQTGPPT